VIGNNTMPIYPYVGQEVKWNLATAMADDAIQWLYQINAINPAMPTRRGGSCLRGRQARGSSRRGALTGR
jgi:hypothetical protein